jgi:hypothetical protein
MIYSGIGSQKYKEAVIHYSESHICFGLAFVSKFILEEEHFSIVSDWVIRTQFAYRDLFLGLMVKLNFETHGSMLLFL